MFDVGLSSSSLTSPTDFISSFARSELRFDLDDRRPKKIDRALQRARVTWFLFVVHAIVDHREKIAYLLRHVIHVDRRGCRVFTLTYSKRQPIPRKAYRQTRANRLTVCGE